MFLEPLLVGKVILWQQLRLKRDAVSGEIEIGAVRKSDVPVFNVENLNYVAVDHVRLPFDATCRKRHSIKTLEACTILKPDVIACNECRTPLCRYESCLQSTPKAFVRIAQR